MEAWSRFSYFEGTEWDNNYMLERRLLLKDEALEEEGFKLCGFGGGWVTTYGTIVMASFAIEASAQTVDRMEAIISFCCILAGVPLAIS